MLGNSKSSSGEIMWLTLLAALGVIGLNFYPDFLPVSSLYGEIAAFMFIGTSLVLILSFFLDVQILAPLVRLEQKSIPNLMTLLHDNFWIYIYRHALMVSVFVSYFLSMLFLANEHHRFMFFASWWILFGFGLDMLRLNWAALVKLLNPSQLVKEFEMLAKYAVQEGQDNKLWQTLDSLSEMALSGVHENKIALSTQAINTFPPIMHAFYNSSKSISHITKDNQVKVQTGQDEASYTLFYLLQRLELINDRALKNRLESVCRHMVMALGRIILYGAKLDLSLVTFPMHFLVKFGLKAQQHHFNEVSELAISTILEVARAIVNEVDLQYAELIAPFQSMIKGLESLAKGEFKQDKFTNLVTLTQPLNDLKALLENPRIAEHRDRPVIEAEVDRALAEFAVLGQVMRAMPSVTDVLEPLEENQ